MGSGLDESIWRIVSFGDPPGNAPDSSTALPLQGLSDERIGRETQVQLSHTPLGGSFGLTPGLVKSDDAPQGLADSGGHRGLRALEDRVAREQKSLRLGVAAPGSQAPAQ